MHAHNSSKGIKLNAYPQFRTLYTYISETFLKNILEPKHMQVFPLKLQHQKVLGDFFKKKRRNL